MTWKRCINEGLPRSSWSVPRKTKIYPFSLLKIYSFLIHSNCCLSSSKHSLLSPPYSVSIEKIAGFPVILAKLSITTYNKIRNKLSYQLCLKNLFRKKKSPWAGKGDILTLIVKSPIKNLKLKKPQTVFREPSANVSRLYCWGFNPSESLCSLFSWVCGPCSPGVLYPLATKILPSSLLCFCT